jgi:hypothetical protein
MKRTTANISPIENPRNSLPSTSLPLKNPMKLAPSHLSPIDNTRNPLLPTALPSKLPKPNSRPPTNARKCAGVMPGGVCKWQTRGTRRCRTIALSYTIALPTILPTNSPSTATIAAFLEAERAQRPSVCLFCLIIACPLAAAGSVGGRRTATPREAFSLWSDLSVSELFGSPKTTARTTRRACNRDGGRLQELLFARVHRAQLVDFSFGVALVRRRCRRNRPSDDQSCSIIVLVHKIS